MKIQSVRLIDETTLEFGDFNVFIGGNAVGKTTLVLELYARATDLRRNRWYWTNADTLAYAIPDPVSDLRVLLHSMARHHDGANLFYLSQAAKNIVGNTELDSRFRFTEGEYRQLRETVEGRNIETCNNIIRGLKYRRPFVSFASCEARLSLPNRVNLTPLNQLPQDAPNVLYRNRELFKEIDLRVSEQFATHLSLLDHIRTQLELGLSKDPAPQFDTTVPDLQTEFERIEAWKGEQFSPMEEIGHGIRSMVKLLMSLLDPVNQVIMIDEPEMHIYPAQKRWLGRQLVSLARERNKQVFLVTHDPIVLQGILDSPGATGIFRIDLDEQGRRLIRHCKLEHVTDVGARRNQDSYLQGLFYQRCIAVEGASDRAFYQVMVEELFRDQVADKDLGFVACGGKGASKNVVYITSRVGARTAFIYDFDALLVDIPVISDIYKTLGGKGNALQRLEDFVRRQFGLDARRIKDGTGNATNLGLQSDFIKDHRGLFEPVLQELEAVGVFIVPDGQLESWARDVEPKFRFAELAPDRIRQDSKCRGQLEEFLRKPLRFLGC